MEAKGRIPGWRFVPLEAKQKKELHEMCASLKDKGVTCVHFSDLDSAAGQIVASELSVPFREDFALRRVNVGWHHGNKADHVERVFETVIGKWKDKPEVPIRGGDSWASIQKRIFKSIEKLLAKDEVIALLTDARTATLIVHQTPESLTMNGKGLKPGKIYQVAHRKS